MTTTTLSHEEWTALASITVPEFVSSFAPDEPFCSPPAAKTPSIQGLAALVDAGQARGTPSKLMTCEQFRELCALRAEAVQ